MLCFLKFLMPMSSIFFLTLCVVCAIVALCTVHCNYLCLFFSLLLFCLLSCNAMSNINMDKLDNIYWIEILLTNLLYMVPILRPELLSEDGHAYLAARDIIHFLSTIFVYRFLACMRWYLVYFMHVP